MNAMVPPTVFAHRDRIRPGWTASVVLWIGLLLLVPTVRAQSPADSSADGATPDSDGRLASWYAFPTLFYTPETRLGGGATGGIFAGGASQPSSVQGDVSVTLNAQYAVNLRAERYRRGGRQRFFTEMAVSEYPDVFYGLGPTTTDAMEETFTDRYVNVLLQMERRVAPGWRVGLRVRGRHDAITEVERSGLLDGPGIPGHDGATIVGIGPVVTRDTRDRLFYPHRGQLVMAYALGHAGWWGSTFDFTRIVLDARQYVPLGHRHVVGLQAYGEAVSGTAPFTVLPRLGGPLRMRGYLEGRFRDDVYATVQGAWRFPLWGRFAGGLFASTGAVAGRLDRFGSDGLEVAGGGGLRFRLNDEGVHIRVDYALSKEGGGLYITAMDAF
jgi:hypothetical protein